MSKILIVVGTRPEVLKMYPVIQELRERRIDFRLVSTGQQKELLKQTLENLNIIPDIDLELMSENQSPSTLLAHCLSRITEIIENYNPTMVIVQGDTTSALAGAMAGYLSKVPVGHVEAGLRSHDLYSPWPEEGFRRLIDSVSNILWFPTDAATRNLEKDQIGLVTGNTIVDTLISYRAKKTITKQRKILVTLHRRESFYKTLDRALENIMKLANETDYEVEFIQHPNPHISEAMTRTNFQSANIQVSQPLPYLDFIEILASVAFVITDSGGLQEEARSLGIPLIVLRENSERMEAIDGKYFRLSKPDGSQIKTDIEEIEALQNNEEFQLTNNPFGDGNAARRIVDSLIENFESSQ